MDQNRVEGGLRDIGGKVQDAAGGLTGDTSTQLRGKVNQVAGQAQQAYGDTIDEVKNFTTAQPITALLTAFGAGIMLGLVIARR